MSDYGCVRVQSFHCKLTSSKDASLAEACVHGLADSYLHVNTFTSS